VTNSPFDQINASIIIKNSTFNENVGGNTLIGICIYSVTQEGQLPIPSVTVQDCVLYDNKTTATSVPVGIYSSTIVLSISVQGIVLKNVVADRIGNSIPNVNSGVPLEVQGIECGGSGVLVEDCQCNNVYGTCITEPMTGFDSEFVTKNATYKNCSTANVINLAALTTPPTQVATGFNINQHIGVSPISESSAFGVTIIDCIAQGVTGPGYLLNSLESALIKNNIGQNNWVGFQMQDIGTVTDPAIPSSNNVLENNRAIGNSQYGFLDLTSTNPLPVINAYIGNTARKPLAFPLSVNFSDIPLGNRIVIWQLSLHHSIPAGTNSIDNLSIV